MGKLFRLLEICTVSLACSTSVASAQTYTPVDYNGAIARAIEGGPSGGGMPPGTFTAPPPMDVSPTASTFPLPALGSNQSISGRILVLAVSPTDSKRLYAAAYSGVWRSDDSGATWKQLVLPQRPDGVDSPLSGALPVPTVTSLAVSPLSPDIVLVAVNGDTRVTSLAGIYRSPDGGKTWTQVDKPTPTFGLAGQVAFAPDDGRLAYAALGDVVDTSINGGLTWTRHSLPAGDTAWHVVAGPRERRRMRHVYAAGDNTLGYSLDGGSTWVADAGASAITAPPVLPLGGSWPCGLVPPTPSFGDRPSSDPGSYSRANDQVLAIEPGHPDHLYVAAYNGANGPSFYFPPESPPTTPPCTFSPSEGAQCNSPSTSTTPGGPQCWLGSLWLGYYSNVSRTSHAATWQKLPGPANYGQGGTHSAGVSVITHPTPTDYLLFFIDGNVNVAQGRPASSSAWHRLDGPNASQNYSSGATVDSQFIHVDFHGIAISSDFNVGLALPPSSIPPPYNQNTVLSGPETGELWIANDGGVVSTTDAGAHFHLGAGLSTLPPINVAGLPLTGTTGPLLMMGMGDNNDFVTLNGGGIWAHPYTNCGDCSTTFADPFQPTRIVSYDWGNPAYFELFNAPPGQPMVNPADSKQASLFPCPSSATSPTTAAACLDTSKVVLGHRPIVQTLPGETPVPLGDYLAFGVDLATGSPALMRILTATAATKPGDWALAATDLPPAAASASVAQASGGHATAVYFVGDPDVSAGLWKSSAGGWQQIVPAADGSASHAYRFFVNPYDPKVIYIRDDFAIKRSDDGGMTWMVDTALDLALTESHTFAYNGNGLINRTVLQDLIFVPNDPKVRFAAGTAGVFVTSDGTTWHRLLDSTAIPCYPEALYFDFHSRKLYVATDGRGLLSFGLLE